MYKYIILCTRHFVYTCKIACIIVRICIAEQLLAYINIHVHVDYQWIDTLLYYTYV